MDFTREIRWLIRGIVAMMGIVAITAAFWAVVGPETILRRADNQRLLEDEARLLRGAFYDRSGRLLAESLPDAGGFVQRRYHEPVFNSVLGYYSMIYGAGGLEAAFDPWLSGADTPAGWRTFIREDVLHLPRAGDDVRLTLDLRVQQSAAQALGERAGAIVVLSVPEGELLALVSSPTFDPNTLDADWETLIADPVQPFFNRALQGQYQPGLLMSLSLMALASADGFPLSTRFEEADAPVTLDGLTLNCALTPADGALTLSEAFFYGCPAPFTELAAILGMTRVEAALGRFVIATSAIGITETRDTVAVVPSTLSADRLAFTIEDVLGQGDLTASPLVVASWMAAIIDEGNAPQPYVFDGLRQSDDADWETGISGSASIPMLTAEGAALLRGLLLEAVEGGSTEAAYRQGLNIGGLTARAYAGDRTLTWFAGFALTGTREGMAVAVLLEDAGTPEQAADMGGQALEAAVRAHQEDS